MVPANAEEIVKQWTALHGLDPASAREETVAGQARRVWRDAKGREVVEAHLVPGIRHGAPVDPGQGGAAGPFMLDAGISSTRHIAAFWGLTTPPCKRTRARAAGLAAKLGGTLRGLGQERRNRGAVSQPRASAVAASA